MKRTSAFLLAVAAASLSQDSSSCHAQDYNGSYGQEENYADYADTQDDLYANYAAKQQEKAAGAGG